MHVDVSPQKDILLYRILFSNPTSILSIECATVLKFAIADERIKGGASVKMKAK